MAPSPGTYVPSPSNVMSSMGSPMNVNMINQRTGPPSVPSGASPNPTLNTPGTHTKHQIFFFKINIFLLFFLLLIFLLK